MGKLKEAVSKLEIEMIKAELIEHSYNVNKVAKALGLSAQGCWLKIRRYKIVMPKVSRVYTTCPECGHRVRQN